MKKMLIDATLPQETRVAIIDGDRLEEFDFETVNKKPLKSNIYLAKVVRVEPSLQAVFVDFGQERHGFLPFSDIHPDYYRIPVADREQLMREIAAEEARYAVQNGPTEAREEDGKSDEFPSAVPLEFEEVDQNLEIELSNSPNLEPELITDTEQGIEIPEVPANLLEETAYPSRENGEDSSASEAIERRYRKFYRRYKVQEVIKKRQIMLVQITKEARGNKCAAVTTYLSLPGRYCVLMPNSGQRSGGISRRITDSLDRKRLREMIDDIELPEGVSVIIRTAGMERNKQEIRRDFEYLLRLWEDIRAKTLSSIAPCLIYEESDLIQRSLRDMYARDVEQILVEGEEAYQSVKSFLRVMMPSHVRRVHKYHDVAQRLFHRFKVDEQLEQAQDTKVLLPSGGYLVMNATEALVAIDVNSGRATRERHIDETALKTNLEAADEIARQLRLRDLGGLIVIDFIDMNDHHHIGAVEKRLREAMRHDRARVQIGRISAFGLLEMSRQRLRSSMVEWSTMLCPHCHGRGVVRSVDLIANQLLRDVESDALYQGAGEIVVRMPLVIVLHLLNHKRQDLNDIEAKYQVKVTLLHDETVGATSFHLERKGSEDASVKSSSPAREERGRNRRSRRGVRAVEKDNVVVALPTIGDQRESLSQTEDKKEKESEEDCSSERGAENIESSPRPRRRRRQRRSPRGHSLEEGVSTGHRPSHKQYSSERVVSIETAEPSNTYEKSTTTSIDSSLREGDLSSARQFRKGWWERFLS